MKQEKESEEHERRKHWDLKIKPIRYGILFKPYHLRLKLFNMLREYKLQTFLDMKSIRIWLNM